MCNIDISVTGVCEMFGAGGTGGFPAIVRDVP